MLKNNLTDYAYCVFDCDGVILNSNSIKENGFIQALSSEPSAQVEAFLLQQHLHGSVSRFRKFKIYYDTYYPSQDNSEKIHQTIQAYAGHVVPRLKECQLISGVQDFLEFLQVHSIPCWVNTGAVETEVKSLLSERDLADYFIDICGAPLTKQENMHRIQPGIDGRGVFFGDSCLDHDVAHEFDLDFVYVSHASEWPAGREVSLASGDSIIENFEQLLTE